MFIGAGEPSVPLLELSNGISSLFGRGEIALVPDESPALEEAADRVSDSMRGRRGVGSERIARKPAIPILLLHSPIQLA